MNIQEACEIAGICGTILACSWRLSSQITGMSKDISNNKEAITKDLNLVTTAIKEHKEDDIRFQEASERRFSELFSQIRNLMTMKIDRTV